MWLQPICSRWLCLSSTWGRVFSRGASILNHPVTENHIAEHLHSSSGVHRLGDTQSSQRCTEGSLLCGQLCQRQHSPKTCRCCTHLWTTGSHEGKRVVETLTRGDVQRSWLLLMVSTDSSGFPACPCIKAAPWMGNRKQL